MFNELHSDPRFREALQQLQLGRFAASGEALAALTPDLQESEQAAFLRALMGRALRPRRTPDRPVLVWQYDGFETWEGQYLRELTSGVVERENPEYHAYTHVSPRMIVVDNWLDARANAYICDAAIAGSDVVLIHLGDEAYGQDCSCYPWCRAVYRNYWSLTHALSSNVHVLPLGYKSGFHSDEPIRPIKARPYVWSFCGDLNKSTRADLKRHMTTLEPSYLHVTSGWDTPDSLNIQQYRAIMDQSIFVPCGFGFCTPESFRVYEALEAGCIPIVERTAEFDYFGSAYGGHPLPVIEHWSEAPPLIQAILDADQAPALAQRCNDWWRASKAQLTASFQACFPN